MIKKTFKHSIGMTGESTLILQTSKKIIDPNTITNVGLSECCYGMLDKSPTQFYFAVGDDDSNITPDEVALQNELKNEISRLQPIIDREVSQQIDGNYAFILRSDFSKNSDPNLIQDPLITLKEMGLFNRYAKGQMFARSQKVPPTTIDFNAIFNGSWLIKVNTNDVITNGGIVLQGSKLVCESFRKRDNLSINYQYDYYDGESSNNFKYPAPYGINLVSLGDNSSSTNEEATDLNSPFTDFDTPPTITDLDLTGEASDVNYAPKVIIQKYIPPNTVNIDIHEAGLFNGRFRKQEFNSINSELIRTMFSRVVLDPFIPANTEAVLTWEITFKRGS